MIWKKVAILSYSNVGNFGDRLGMHIISYLLPSTVEVENLYFTDISKKY